MTIYVGMTQDLALAREYLLKMGPGMYPDVEMGPFKRIDEAIGYIQFMKKRCPGVLEIELPQFPVEECNAHRWYVFSFEYSDEVH
jgi:hypothetical protein